jgi:hypothetical protein
MGLYMYSGGCTMMVGEEIAGTDASMLDVNKTKA